MSQKLKLCWISDHASIPRIGQSIVSNEILKRLKDIYDITMLGFAHGAIKNPIELSYPSISCERTDFNNPSKIVELLKGINPDIVVFSHDIFLFPHINIVRATLPNIKFLGYITHDAENVYHQYREMLKPWHKIVMPSYNSRDAFLTRWFDLNIDVVPYGLNHEIFHPPAQGKAQIKHDISMAHQHLGGYLDISNKFVAIIIANNQSRKNLGLAYEAWGEFVKNKNDCIYIMIIHSSTLEGENGDYDIATIQQSHPSIRIITDTLSDPTIGSFMAAADVNFHPSSGEGFGLTVLQGMATGTVPIIIPYAAVRDFCTPENSYDIPFITHVGGLMSHRALSDPTSTAEVLEKAYNEWKSGEIVKKQLAGIEVAKNYTWDKTAIGIKRNIDEVLAMTDDTIYMQRVK